MNPNIRTVFLYVSASIVFLASVYHLLLPNASTSDDTFRSFNPQLYIPNPRLRPYAYKNLIVTEQEQEAPYDDEETTNSVEFNADGTIHSKPHFTIASNQGIDVNTAAHGNNYSLFGYPMADESNINVSILFPAWEALVIVSSEDVDDKNYTSYFCLFDTMEIYPAKFSGILPYPDRKTFTCHLPKRVRRRLPFRQPVLTNKPDEDKKRYNPLLSWAPELLRWNFIVYDIVETEDDVVLFVKGINNRQGVNRSPTEFKCLFGESLDNGVKTSVTSSLQEVFRCQRPDLTAFSPIRASLLVSQTNQPVPSIAYYTPQRKVATGGGAKLPLCACTMVYNVAKLLKEWVIYHSEIGVDKFILYDNGSDDDLGIVVNELKVKGYDIETQFWLWPKTQEAGFSHATLLAKDSCHWMMYIDVDEFLYSPLWRSSQPSKSLLQSFLPRHPIGQLLISCYEFGPSNQKKHPTMGVTQGYNCRKEMENRHKSIVLLDAIDESLLNVVHHFKLKDRYTIKNMDLETAVVNHYKFQAWPEFKAKFRRRVSAYVVDWTRTVNLRSNDRTPGLGYHAVEPKGWAHSFCQVYDNRLKDLTMRWFGRREAESRICMAWQR